MEDRRDTVGAGKSEEPTICMACRSPLSTTLSFPPLQNPVAHFSV